MFAGGAWGVLEGGSDVAVFVQYFSFVDSHDPVETDDEEESEDEDDYVSVGAEAADDRLACTVCEKGRPDE